MHAVVVGGGIVGLASAYYLAEAGVDVTVCEKASLGGGSTGRSAGGIRAQFSTPVNVDLSLASMEVWDGFAETFGVDIARRQVGYLFLARSPGLRTEPFAGATYSPADGFADPHLALRGFAAGARDAGAEIRTGVEVTDVRRDDERAVGVVAGGDRIDADHVVNAAGPWAREVAAMAGIEIPVAPRRRQALVAEPATPVPEDDPLVIDLEAGVYFRPEREGLALVGGHFAAADPEAEPDGYEGGIDLDWAAEAVERAADVADYFGPDTRIKRGWAGLYAVTPDHHPVIEETIPGFLQAVGFSGHGFQHAPAAGRIVAEIATEGEASLVDVSRLRSGRFEDGDLLAERNVA